MNSGIYAIFNSITNKIYVGSAVNFDERWRLHLLAFKNGKHHNRHMQRAWDKYGESSFTMAILEIVYGGLTEREQFYIEKLNATNPEYGYNICKVARNRQGVKASDETRKKLSLAHIGNFPSEETKAKMSASKIGNRINNGRIQTEEHKLAISKAKKGHITTEETRAKISAAHKGKKASEEAKIKMSIAARNRRIRETEDAKPLDYTCDMWV